MPAPVEIDSATRATLVSMRLLAPGAGHRTVLRVIGVIGAGVLLSLFLPWQQTVRASGTVTALRPIDRPQEVQALVGGRVAVWHVTEGQYVRANDPILELTETSTELLDPDALARERERLAALREVVSAKRAKAAALEQRLGAMNEGFVVTDSQTRNRLRQASATATAAALDSGIAAEQRRRAEALYRDGLRSLAEVENARLREQRAIATLAEQRASLANAELALAGLDATIAENRARAQGDLAATRAEIAEGEEKVAALRMRVANLARRQDAFTIRAPQEGYVVRALPQGVGEIVGAGAAVVTIQPAQPSLAAELKVRAMDVPLLEPGGRVRLQFDGWPALQFSGWPSVSVGTFGGVVAVIDRVDDGTGRYRILVRPDPTDEAWPSALRIGSGVNGWAMVGRVRVWFEIWRILNGFPPSIDQKSAGAAAAPAAPAAPAKAAKP